MSEKKLISIIKNFPRVKIGVIGDIMLDHYIWGDIVRISPEAPVPIVAVGKESYAPGAAGNTANNISQIGGQVFLITVFTDDLLGKILKQKLKQSKIQIDGSLTLTHKTTVEKIRVIARGQHVLRVDKDTKINLNTQEKRKLLNYLRQRIKDLDCLVISDYAKGLITKSFIQQIINIGRKKDKIIIVDAKPQDIYWFRNVTLVTPNYHEAREITNKKNVKDMGKMIQKQLNCNVLITQGAQGMTLFEKQKIKHFSTKAREVFDVSGAGDTVVALLALALGAGAKLEQAIQIANHAAGIVVGKLGTSTVSSKELIKDLKDNGQKDKKPKSNY